MAKKVTIKKKPTARQADNWVGERMPESRVDPKISAKETPEDLRRFTIDISEKLHRKIKAKAAMEGETMAKMLRRILEHEFSK